MRRNSLKTYICKTCKKRFQSYAARADRCPEHRKEYRKRQQRERWRRLNPPSDHISRRPSDIQRINASIDKTAHRIRCPVCKRKMVNCLCYKHEGLQVKRAEVATWKPWK